MDMQNKKENVIESISATEKIPVFMIVKSVVLVLTWICYGMAYTITSATLPDLMTRYGVDVEVISQAMALGGVGNLIGAPLASAADRYKNKVDLMMSVCLYVAAISVFIKPVTNMTMFAVAFFSEGVGWMCINSMGTSLMMDMWGPKGKVPLHILSFGFPLGSMIAPLIAYPFVSKAEDNTTEPIYNSSFTTEGFDYDSVFEYPDNSRIEIPYMIISLLTGLMATIFLVFQISGLSISLPSWQAKKDMKWKDLVSVAKWADGDFKFGATMCALIVGFYVIMVLGTVGITFYPTYAVESHLQFTNSEAALLSSVINFVGAFGRLIAIGLAMFISINHIIFIEVYGGTLFAILTIIFGLNSKLSFVLFCCCFNLFINPVWPTNYVWIDQYIPLLATVMAVCDISSSIMWTFGPWLTGYLYSNTVMESLFYLAAGVNSCLCVFVLVRHFIAEKHGNRYVNAANKASPFTQEVKEEGKLCPEVDDGVTVITKL